ncbi:FAXC-like protein [Mya arenaria]|uniref:FAXC-like protein n=1 Tax=Mya arenaria TaxID=6604 RepID=A0ABY7DPF9_MYAAR|nr:FAXC-like protein [Mya arenaria]
MSGAEDTSPNEPHPQWKPEYKRDHVYLHVIPRDRAKGALNISPFAIKLEFWLRINKIPFETIDSEQFSSKKQSPFILFNGEEIPDSNFIVEFLCKKFKKDPYPGLGPIERATSRAFLKMTEENMTWPIFVYRYVEHTDEYADYFFPTVPREQRLKILETLTDWVGKRAYGHGIGRHASADIQKIGCDDIQAISDYLADKNFIMGDTPSLVAYVPMKYPMRIYLFDKCPNIIRFLNRMRDNYWPEWPRLEESKTE